MTDRSAEAGRSCNFELAPPRNFLYPAVLLLVSERPRHGYGLVRVLAELGFGEVDRPSVYRTLAQLESDELVWSREAPQTAGPRRNVYEATERGARVLAEWMEVIAAERDGLERMLQRFDLHGAAERRGA